MPKKLSKKVFVPIIAVACILISLSIIFLSKKEVSAPSQKPLITSSFYPNYFVATAIGRSNIDTKNITPAGSEPHDYEPTSKDIQSIYDSKLFVYNGAGVESWAPKTAKSADEKGVKILKTSDKVVLFDTDDEDEIQEGNTKDPHIWVDPINMKIIAGNIRDNLSQIDPKNKQSYTENTDTLNQKLDDLDQKARFTFANCSQKKFVTTHNAFGYFARRYGLEGVSINGISPDKEPSTQELADLVEQIKTQNIKTIFTETLVSPKLADTLARETGAKTLTLNPLEGLTDDQIKAGDDYITIMNQNIANLAIGLECKTN